MKFFDLSLAPRLALAATSGVLTYPAIKLDAALGPDTYLLFSWWLILHGLLFGMLVMAPFVADAKHRVLRVVALAVASVFIYDAAIRAPDLVRIEFLGDTGDYLLAGITGALLVATAVRFIAWRRATLRYWGLVFVAGIVGGYVFSHSIEVCAWDRCDAIWEIPLYLSGWITWQILVCAALYLGLHRETD